MFAFGSRLELDLHSRLELNLYTSLEYRVQTREFRVSKLVDLHTIYNGETIGKLSCLQIENTVETIHKYVI